MWKSTSCWTHMFDSHTSSKYQIQEKKHGILTVSIVPCVCLLGHIYFNVFISDPTYGFNISTWCYGVCYWKDVHIIFVIVGLVIGIEHPLVEVKHCFIHAFECISITTFNTSIYSTVYQTLTSDVQSQMVELEFDWWNVATSSHYDFGFIHLLSWTHNIHH